MHKPDQINRELNSGRREPRADLHPTEHSHPPQTPQTLAQAHENTHELKSEPA